MLPPQPQQLSRDKRIKASAESDDRPAAYDINYSFGQRTVCAYILYTPRRYTVVRRLAINI